MTGQCDADRAFFKKPKGRKESIYMGERRNSTRSSPVKTMSYQVMSRVIPGHVMSCQGQSRHAKSRQVTSGRVRSRDEVRSHSRSTLNGSGRPNRVASKLRFPFRAFHIYANCYRATGVIREEVAADRA